MGSSPRLTRMAQEQSTLTVSFTILFFTGLRVQLLARKNVEEAAGVAISRGGQPFLNGGTFRLRLVSTCADFA
jgi:hypothetical protein